MPLAISAYRFDRVLDVRRDLRRVRMMDVSYWNGLQMLQYSSAFGPVAAVVQLVRIVDVVVPLVAVVLPGDVVRR